MKTLEIVAFGIVALFIAVRAWRGPNAKRFLSRLAILVVASWIAEDTCIRAYGFYYYDPGWSLFVDHVPIAILLIWPVVIHSAWELARQLCRHPDGAWSRYVPLFGALLVLADASMIEPIAVQAGLWTWTEPGLFRVPPLGIIGWAFHAGLCMVVLERMESAPKGAWRDMWCWATPVGTHALLLVSWWGLFRWINVTLPPWPFVAVGWAIAMGLAAVSLKRRARERIHPHDMLARIPAALFFFVLLWLHGRNIPALVTYAFAFAPPYLSLTRLRVADEAEAQGGSEVAT